MYHSIRMLQSYKSQYICISQISFLLNLFGYLSILILSSQRNVPVETKNNKIVCIIFKVMYICIVHSCLLFAWQYNATSRQKCFILYELVYIKNEVKVGLLFRTQ